MQHRASVADPYLDCGAVPGTALIVVDMLNPYDHDDADALGRIGRGVGRANAAELVRRAGEDTLTVYVNDNHDHWEAGREELVRRALDGRHPELVEPVVPPAGTPFLVKGRHSIFYETAVAHLLRSRGIKRLVLCGQVTEQCILYSALDAYLRGFEVAIPPDAVAHIHAGPGRGRAEDDGDQHARRPRARRALRAGRLTQRVGVRRQPLPQRPGLVAGEPQDVLGDHVELPRGDRRVRGHPALDLPVRRQAGP